MAFLLSHSNWWNSLKSKDVDSTSQWEAYRKDLQPLEKNYHKHTFLKKYIVLNSQNLKGIQEDYHSISHCGLTTLYNFSVFAYLDHNSHFLIGLTSALLPRLGAVCSSPCNQKDCPETHCSCTPPPSPQFLYLHLWTGVRPLMVGPQLPLQPYLVACPLVFSLMSLVALFSSSLYYLCIFLQQGFCKCRTWECFPCSHVLINFYLFFGSCLDSYFLSDVLSDLPPSRSHPHALLRTMHLSSVTCIIFILVRIFDLTPYLP